MKHSIYQWRNATYTKSAPEATKNFKERPPRRVVETGVAWVAAGCHTNGAKEGLEASHKRGIGVLCAAGILIEIGPTHAAQSPQAAEGVKKAAEARSLLLCQERKVIRAQVLNLCHKLIVRLLVSPILLCIHSYTSL